MDTRIPIANAFYDQIDLDTHDSPYVRLDDPVFMLTQPPPSTSPERAVPTLNADAPIVETLAAVDTSSDSLDPDMLPSSTTRRRAPSTTPARTSPRSRCTS